MASLEERVAALENRLAVVESLRSLTDADLSALEIKVSANERLLKAMASTQSDHTQALREIRVTLGEHSAHLETVVTLLNELIRRDDDRRTGIDGVSE
jgi:hypothetical protein